MTQMTTERRIESALTQRINAAHELCEASARSTVKHAAECGRLLAEAKALCPHGTWLPWLRDNFAGGERTAQTYMRIATHPKAQRVADLPLREAIQALAEPKAIQELYDEAVEAIRSATKVLTSSDHDEFNAWLHRIDLNEWVAGCAAASDRADAARRACCLKLRRLLDDNPCLAQLIDIQRKAGELQNLWAEHKIRLERLGGFAETVCQACDERAKDLGAVRHE